MIIYAILRDGTRNYLLTVPKDFDVQVWANKRVESFKLLDIIRLVVQEV